MKQGQAKTVEDELVELMATCAHDPLRHVMVSYPWGEPGPLESETGPDEWQIVILNDVRDALVAGIHFFPDDPPDSIGRKALGVNLSDLAAKGSRPEGFLLTIALPEGWSEEPKESSYRIALEKPLSCDQLLAAMLEATGTRKQIVGDDLAAGLEQTYRWFIENWK